MTSSRAILRRRELLGALGASAFLAAPVFRQTLAEAQSGAPKRAIFFQFPGGVPSACYQLHTCGTNDLPDLAYFNFDGQLASLKPVQSDTLLFKNLRFAAAERDSAEGHEAGMRNLLTGGGNTSIDQAIAKQVGNLTKFSSLQFAGLPWPGATPQDRIAYSDGFALQQERDPVVMFEKLFAGFTAPTSGGSMPDPAAELRKAREKSILDFLKTEVTTLQGATSSAEKPLLDKHLESLRELEKQLTQVATGAGTACAAPDQTGVVKGEFAQEGGVDIRKLAALQLDLLYQAINCDLTRIATFQWAPSVEVIATFDWIPEYAAAPDQHHGFQHDHESPENEIIFQKIQTWYTDQMGGFVNRLKATSEGGGSVLDNSIVVITSEMSNGIHIHSPLPVMIAGRGGGAFQKLGQTVDAQGKAHNDLWLSIAQAMGVPLASIGDPGLSGTPLSL
ncbi:MAG: DUF1552 domain-containing protein [Polyangiaceae bacterium]|nr:DUF1552 domain-containing protein [Polyangiaceae bacterium]